MNTLLTQPYTNFFHDLILQGGPTPEDDETLSDTISRIYADIKADLISSNEIDKIREAMNLNLDTMQGFVYLKPNGYAGCFETIERIYQKYHSPDPQLYNWDRYCQNHPATQAVRNRKEYFMTNCSQSIRNKTRAKDSECC